MMVANHAMDWVDLRHRPWSEVDVMASWGERNQRGVGPASSS